MKIENVLNNIVFVSSDDLTALLETGVLPPAVIARAVAWGHVPYTHATAKMLSQAAYSVNDTIPAMDIPGLYAVVVKCADDGGDYPLRMDVAQLDWC